MRPGKNSTNSLSNLSLFGAQETRFASLARKAALAALHWSKGRLSNRHHAGGPMPARVTDAVAPRAVAKPCGRQ
jgi:hypothetical protein